MRILRVSLRRSIKGLDYGGGGFEEKEDVDASTSLIYSIKNDLDMEAIKNIDLNEQLADFISRKNLSKIFGDAMSLKNSRISCQKVADVVCEHIQNKLGDKYLQSLPLVKESMESCFQNIIDDNLGFKYPKLHKLVSRVVNKKVDHCFTISELACKRRLIEKRDFGFDAFEDFKD